MNTHSKKTDFWCQETPTPQIFAGPSPDQGAGDTEETHHSPLHVVKAEVPSGLRYYSDESPSLPEIREMRSENSGPRVTHTVEETRSISNDVFAPHAPHRMRPIHIAGFAALGISIFIFSAVVSSVISLNLNIEAGNAASVSYSLHW